MFLGVDSAQSFHNGIEMSSDLCTARGVVGDDGALRIAVGLRGDPKIAEVGGPSEAPQRNSFMQDTAASLIVGAPVMVSLIWLWAVTLFGWPFALIGLLVLVSVVAYIMLRLELECGPEFRRMHAAEHMAIAAWRRHRRAPTVEEAAGESRLSFRCGAKMLSFMILAPTFYALAGLILPLGWAVVAATLAIMLQLAINGHHPVSWLSFWLQQQYTTAPPTRLELRVATLVLAALIKFHEAVEAELFSSPDQDDK